MENLHLRGDPENEAQGRTSQLKKSLFVFYFILYYLFYLSLITVTVSKGLTDHLLMNPP